MTDQVWVINGRQPVLWSVPFVVRWVSANKARMIHAIPLLTIQLQAVEELLRIAAEKRGQCWFIEKQQLEEIGHQVHGNPEHFFSWERVQQEQKTEVQQDRKELCEFLDALYQRGIGRSRAEVEYWHHQLCQHMLDWIVNKEKAVDLYWLKLHPSLYRANWKDIILRRFPRLGPLLMATQKIERECVLAESGLKEELVNLDLLSMKPRSVYCYRHVEVELTPTWWKETRHVEEERFKALGAVDYAKNVMASVRRRLKTSLRLYCQFLADIARPSATNVESGKEGEFGLAPHRPANPNAIHSHHSYLVHSVVSDKFPAFSGPSEPKFIFREEPSVPTLPDIQREREDVRNGGGHIPWPNGKT